MSGSAYESSLLLISEVDDSTLAAAVDLFEQYRAWFGASDHERGAEFIAARHERHEGRRFVAVVDGQTVALAQVYLEFSSVHATFAWRLNDVFVAPAGRRRGVGRQLVQYVIDQARADGAIAVHLESREGNSAARELYESVGFVLADQGPAYLGYSYDLGERSVFHIISESDWAAAQESGFVQPASLDVEGFIHCSTREQVSGTLRRHFESVDDLLVLDVAVADVERDLRWEGDPQRFPHLYGPLDVTLVRAVEPASGGGGHRSGTR